MSDQISVSTPLETEAPRVDLSDAEQIQALQAANATQARIIAAQARRIAELEARPHLTAREMEIKYALRRPLINR